jgi:hypothetical protein
LTRRTAGLLILRAVAGVAADGEGRVVGNRRNRPLQVSISFSGFSTLKFSIKSIFSCPFIKNIEWGIDKIN